jgi:hypothetical protein
MGPFLSQKSSASDNNQQKEEERANLGKQNKTKENARCVRIRSMEESSLMTIVWFFFFSKESRADQMRRSTSKQKRRSLGNKCFEMKTENGKKERERERERRERKKAYQAMEAEKLGDTPSRH